MSSQILKIYLHWTGTSYIWRDPGSYHTIIDHKGEAYRLTNYHTPLTRHTYGRNSNSVAISMACMGGRVWVDYPPTPKQIDGMAKETAKVAVGLGWEPDAKYLEYRIMTHAEAAANRDYPRPVVEQAGTSEARAKKLKLPHENYGPQRWHDAWPGGLADRWDLYQLTPNDTPGTGGYLMRDRVVGWMKQILASK